MNKYNLLAVILAIISTVHAQNPEQKPRILIYHDMEGLAGENDWRMFNYNHPQQYAIGRSLLTTDVNAVIEGLFQGGAGSVQVVDAHGSGNYQPDILLDKLDKRATMLTRDSPFRTYVDIIEPNTFDAIVCVGMHAKTGSAGFASHTDAPGIEIFLNDESIAEPELIAYSWGRVGVPVIFASGDDKLANDLKSMTWIEYVTVKKSTSATTVELRPVDEVRKELTAKAALAVSKIASATVMKLREPVKVSVHAVPPANLQAFKGFPGIDYADNTVTFTAPDFAKAYDGITSLISIARLGFLEIIREEVRKLPNGKQLQIKFDDARYARWLDFESGRWKPKPTTIGPPRKYYGAN